MFEVTIVVPGARSHAPDFEFAARLVGAHAIVPVSLAQGKGGVHDETGNENGFVIALGTTSPRDPAGAPLPRTVAVSRPHNKARCTGLYVLEVVVTGLPGCPFLNHLAYRGRLRITEQPHTKKVAAVMVHMCTGGDNPGRWVPHPMHNKDGSKSNWSKLVDDDFGFNQGWHWECAQFLNAKFYRMNIVPHHRMAPYMCRTPIINCANVRLLH
jgi:hypothetical protein